MSDDPKVHKVGDLQAFTEQLRKQAEEEPLEVPPLTDTSPERLSRLHAMHIRRYRGRLDAANNGATGYRPSELVHLIKLWNEVEAKKFIFADLSEKAKAEVVDAIFDEE